MEPRYETCLVFLNGYPGMGKRTVGGHLAQLLDGVLVDNQLIEPHPDEVVQLDTTTIDPATNAQRILEVLVERGYRGPAAA